MEDQTWFLEDIEFNETEVDVDKIRSFESESQFISLGVELFKEVGIISAVLSTIIKLDDANKPRLMERNEAILSGLMVRICKLEMGILDQVCQDRMEFAFILFRCLAESLINLKYLLDYDSEDIFDEYVEYSLRTEKRLYNMIEESIKERGYELPIEKRMKISMYKSFQTSLFSFDQVDESKWKPWGETIYKRAKSIGMEEAYLGIFGLPSHFVHGSWQDLISNHLVCHSGKFTITADWTPARPQLVLAAAQMTCIILNEYLEKVIPDSYEKERLKSKQNDLSVRISVVSELFEEFLEKKGTE